ncbi:MAG: MlaD family protein [Deltaproteobacteria bacterium]|jgi:ABC-type transporter Mla subunit MlaD|nr:MlaD family protein [Deltaproteobacteria bacterium]
MLSKVNYIKIGVFTVAALVLVVGAVLYFGLSSAFKNLLECQTYFNHTVQGLSSGASVHFRGFRVGQVSRITLPVTSEGSGKQLMVKVEFTVDPELLMGRTGADDDDARRLLEREINNKLRCFLSFQGVSGLGYLNLDYLEPNSQEEPVIYEPNDKLVIPSAKGAIMAIGESLSQILESLSKVDFEVLDRSMNSTLKSVNTLSDTINSDIHALSGSITESLANFDKASAEITTLMAKLTNDLEALNVSQKSTEVGNALRRLAAVLSQAEALTRNTKNSLPATMENLRVMSENLREVSEMAKRYPSQILFGQPPTEVKQ